MNAEQARNNLKTLYEIDYTNTILKKVEYYSTCRYKIPYFVCRENSHWFNKTTQKHMQSLGYKFNIFWREISWEL